MTQQQQYDSHHTRRVPSLNAIQYIITIVRRDVPDFDSKDAEALGRAVADVLKEEESSEQETF